MTSQYFANFYLSEVDHFAKEVLRIPVYLRYMDDFLFFGGDMETVKSQLNMLGLMIDPLKLEFKPPIVVKTEVGVSFLGYKLRRHRIALNVRSRNRLKQKLATYDTMYENGIWKETEYNVHLQPLLAFAEKAYSKRLRRRLVAAVEGQKS